MRNSGKTAATWALRSACASALAAGMLAGGCNKLESPARQADRAVEDNLAKSQMDRATGNEKGDAAAFDDLKKAAGVTDASAPAKIRAKSELAREEFARASAQLPAISRQSLQMEQILWDFRQAGSQILATQRTGASYAKLEPKESLAKVEEDRAEIKKNADKAKADADAAQAEIDKRQKEIDGLKEERKKADGDADALTEKSGAAKGEESVKLFAEASEARTKAGTLAAQIEIKTAALSPLQHSLAIAKKQQQVWDSAAKDTPGAMQQLDDRKQQLESGWTDTQAQISALNDSAKKILVKTVAPGGDAEHPNPGAKLVKLAADNDKLRTESAKLLNDSIKHFGEAATAAKQLHTDLQGIISKAKDASAPELKPLKALVALYDEDQYLLAQGNAQNVLGDLYAGQVVELQHRKQAMDDLGKVLQASSLQVPQELPAADPAKAIEDATKAYKDAEQILEKISNETRLSGDLQVIKNAALVGLLQAHLGRYQLTHDDDAKKAFNLDRQRAVEATVELPSSLKQTLE